MVHVSLGLCFIQEVEKDVKMFIPHRGYERQAEIGFRGHKSFMLLTASHRLALLVLFVVFDTDDVFNKNRYGTL